MTATNHVATGALVAVYIQRPLVAIPVAFVMHFLLDGIPHFRITAKNDSERFHKKAFLKFLGADIAVATILLVTLPIILSQVVTWWLVLACMIACASPDLAWGWRFFQSILRHSDHKKSRFSRFHSVIQWSETPNGLYVEAAWLLLISLLVILNSHR